MHACTVSAACEKSNLGTVRTLRCAPSIASAAFLGQIEFLPRTCSTQFCRFGRKEEKKTTSNIAPKGTKVTTSNVRTSKLSISACGRATNTVQAPAQSLLSVRKREPVSRCFQREGESPRSRKSATFFVMSCLDTAKFHASWLRRGPASLAYMAQQITCTRGAVGESGPAYIALCPNYWHAAYRAHCSRRSSIRPVMTGHNARRPSRPFEKNIVKSEFKAFCNAQKLWV